MFDSFQKTAVASSIFENVGSLRDSVIKKTAMSDQNTQRLSLILQASRSRTPVALPRLSPATTRTRIVFDDLRETKMAGQDATAGERGTTAVSRRVGAAFSAITGCFALGMLWGTIANTNPSGSNLRDTNNVVRRRSCGTRGLLNNQS